MATVDPGQNGARSVDAAQPVAPTSVSTDELVERAARHQPDAPAVLGPDAALSYRELIERAGALAHHLIGSGATIGTPVAVRLPRSAEQIMVVLAVWQAGGICVPVDPVLPTKRMDSLLAMSGASLVIHPGGRIERIAGTPGGRPVGDEPGTTDTGAGDRLAYIFFTSGSTGEPKGVGIPHAGIVNEALWTRSAFQLQPRDRGSWLSSPGFAISRWELWSPLVAGASVVVAEENLAWEGPAVRDWLLRNQITWSIAVTALGEQLFDQQWPANCCLRLLITGGEQLRKWPRGLPFDVVNSYGVTETSGVRLVARLGSPSGDRLPPIGRPISNTRIHILDQQGAPVIPGEIGELYIGGTGLARGYLNRPDLTAERFFPDPFSTAGGHLYRTGDLVRTDEHGEVEFVGRRDDEVKISGVRVCTAEVEAALLSHPDVAAAAVMVRTTDERRAALVGYLVPRPGAVITAHELRHFLAQRLPGPMVPTRFILLAQLPLLISGKVDRSALAGLDTGTPLVDGYIVPADEVERQVVAIVENVLGHEPVGGHDDFFTLGGDSLGLVRVKRELERTFAVDLPLAAVLQARTPRRLAALIRQPAPATGAAPPSTRPGGVVDEAEWIECLGGGEILDLIAVLDREDDR